MNVNIAYSNKKDGDMSSSSSSYLQANQAMTRFLKSHNILPSKTTRINLSYDTNNFCRYLVSNHHTSSTQLNRIKETTPKCDAFVVTDPNHAIILLLADCIGAAIFDPEKNVLMLSHLGRHSLEQNGFYQSVEFLKMHFKSRPSHLKVWLSPSAGKDAYPLYSLKNKGLKEVVYEQIVNSGVVLDNVVDNKLETTSDSYLYSHTLFVNGKQETDGRQAMVAMMSD